MVTENLKKFTTPVFPFTAIVGQEEMKLALQLNVIDPKIGGVMIMGDRGTGKSTTIRAIADLLPEIEVVKDDPFNSHKSDLDLMGPEVKLAIQNNQVPETELIKIPMVDLPVPRSPMIITPPIFGSITFNCNANFISSCPTIAVKGKTGVLNFFKSSVTIAYYISILLI